MSLKEKLMEDLKTSMKNKDILRKNTITMVRAAIKQEEVDKRIDLDDEGIIQIMGKQLKEKRNSIEEFQKGNRQDLVDQAEAEIAILLEYLPKQLTEEELTEIVKEVLDQGGYTSMKDMGKIMKDVMPKVQGKADGNMVNQVVRKILA
ncbi:GatB/YqeY domain-containing protein [Neofamilia massiliensis]|uniref:GatB/YqeY domain-containing protein n=1 Tax=Neofamilia massiliensis TaxID=1673724 RepID=UPI0006BB6B54|nr:GatB/YqeY domain-containing protein [Neofamilia massiliensis]